MSLQRDMSRGSRLSRAASTRQDAARLSRTALSEADDETYFEVLTNDILHVQSRLAQLAQCLPPSLVSCGQTRGACGAAAVK